MLKRLKANQPIATTGLLAHSYSWFTSPSQDKHYKNPVFNASNQATVVYCIHGTGDQAGAFKPLAHKLLKEGLSSQISELILLVFEHRYQGKSIEFFAEELRDKITHNSHNRVILIAHSRGGLVASYFAEYLAERANIEVVNIIAIAAPFNGSYLAIQPMSSLSQSVKEMNVDSKFLKQLKTQIMQPPILPYFFITASNDAVVPGDAGYVHEYVEQYPESLTNFDRHGHLSVMTSNRLVNYINNLLSPPFIVRHLAEYEIIEDYRP